MEAVQLSVLFIILFSKSDLNFLIPLTQAGLYDMLLGSPSVATPYALSGEGHVTRRSKLLAVLVLTGEKHELLMKDPTSSQQSTVKMHSLSPVRDWGE